MSTYKNLMTVCCAAVLALGLAACGSSSDDKKADTGMMESEACPDDGTGDWTVNTLAIRGADTNTPVAYSLAAADGTTIDDDDKATYTGSAVGMSVLKTDNAAGDGQDIDSGSFTASVTLNATFGATAADQRIGGHIHNFVGDATSDSWRVTLEDAALATGGTASTGDTVATGLDGVWTNSAYGPANARPTGVFGHFNAHFSDGHAAGAYATRKPDAN